MPDRTVLFATTNFFASPFQVGSHHLAREFANAGWRVAFVSNPVSPLHWFGRGDAQVRQRWQAYRQGGQLDPATGIWAYVPAALLPPNPRPLLRSSAIARNWWRW